MQIEEFQIAHRFRGPPRSGNGGYVCGRIARHLRGTVAVRLKAPPPLDVALRLESAEAQARLFHDATLLGEARPAQLDLQVPPCPSYEEATAAEEPLAGLRNHAFGSCFVCGVHRKPGDGLRIFPGPLADSSTVAAPWVPDPSLADEAGVVQPEFLWSALDCAGAFALFPLPEGVGMVLGELAASIVGEIRTGERCVVLGWPLGVDGRKRFAGTAIYGADGRLVGSARAVWMEIALSAWS